MAGDEIWDSFEPCKDYPERIKIYEWIRDRVFFLLFFFLSRCTSASLLQRHSNIFALVCVFFFFLFAKRGTETQHAIYRRSMNAHLFEREIPKHMAKCTVESEKRKWQSRCLACEIRDTEKMWSVLMHLHINYFQITANIPTEWMIRLPKQNRW